MDENIHGNGCIGSNGGVFIMFVELSSDVEVRADKISVIKYFDEERKISLLVDGSWVSVSFHSMDDYEEAIEKIQRQQLSWNYP